MEILELFEILIGLMATRNPYINSPVEYGKYPIIYQGFIMFYTSQMVIAGFLPSTVSFVLAVMSFCLKTSLFSLKNPDIFYTQFSLLPTFLGHQASRLPLCLDRGCIDL